MHKVVPEIRKHITIPILHIADATIAELKRNNITKVALLGTKYTMTQDFYKQRIIDQNIDVLIPQEKDLDIVNSIIFDELCYGKKTAESQQQYLRVIDELITAGAEGIILGCTEIGLLIRQVDVKVPVFDTTEIHSKMAVEKALSPD